MATSVIETKRKEHGLSRSKLSRILDVSETYIVQIERQGKTPSVRLLCKLSDLFECSVDELIGRETNSKDE